MFGAKIIFVVFSLYITIVDWMGDGGCLIDNPQWIVN